MLLLVSALFAPEPKPPSFFQTSHVASIRILNSRNQPGSENYHDDNSGMGTKDGGRQLLSMYCFMYVKPPEMPSAPPVYVHFPPCASPPANQDILQDKAADKARLCALPPDNLNPVPKKMVPLHARRLAGRHARHGRDADLGVDVEHAARAARRPQARGGRLPAVVAEVEAVERAVKVKLLGLLLTFISNLPPLPPCLWSDVPGQCSPKSNKSSWKSPRPPAPAPRARSNQPR